MTTETSEIMNQSYTTETSLSRAFSSTIAKFKVTATIASITGNCWRKKGKMLSYAQTYQDRHAILSDFPLLCREQFSSLGKLNKYINRAAVFESITHVRV